MGSYEANWKVDPQLLVYTAPKKKNYGAREYGKRGSYVSSTPIVGSDSYKKEGEHHCHPIPFLHPEKGLGG